MNGAAKPQPSVKCLKLKNKKLVFYHNFSSLQTLGTFNFLLTSVQFKGRKRVSVNCKVFATFRYALISRRPLSWYR